MDEPLYYAKGMEVWKSPVRTKIEGGESVSLGFHACTASEAVGEEGAIAIAALLCLGEQAQAAPKNNMTDIIAAFERAYPDIYWHIAKGRLSEAEPIYGATINSPAGDEIGAGESDVSIEDVFAIAIDDAGISWPVATTGGSHRE